MTNGFLNCVGDGLQIHTDQRFDSRSLLANQSPRWAMQVNVIDQVSSIKQLWLYNGSVTDSFGGTTTISVTDYDLRFGVSLAKEDPGSSGNPGPFASTITLTTNLAPGSFVPFWIRLGVSETLALGLATSSIAVTDNVLSSVPATDTSLVSDDAYIVVTTNREGVPWECRQVVEFARTKYFESILFNFKSAIEGAVVNLVYGGRIYQLELTNNGVNWIDATEILYYPAGGVQFPELGRKLAYRFHIGEASVDRIRITPFFAHRQ